MKKLVLLLSLFNLSSATVLSQCTETDVTRVMLIGDSWAQFMNTDNTINPVFEKWGHSNYKFYSNSTLAANGTQTGDFLTSTRLNEIQTRLAQYPDIDFVHLSLGGNDVLNNWDVTYTPFQTDSLLDSVYARLTTLIDFIKQQRPGIRVLWSGYCYPNFGEIIGELSNPSAQPFYGTWQGMGFPDFVQLNGILNDYSAAMDTLAANDPQVDFVKATGLMQYVYGQTTPLAVPPGGTYAPYTVPLPLGDPAYPSPKASMRNYLFFRDCFHLSAAGYSELINYHTQKYYHKALMDDQYVLSDGGTRDGSVSSTGAVSSTLQLGNNGTDDLALSLSFNTSTVPDTGIAAASIFLRRSALTGTNPMANPATLQVRVSNGAFGSSADVEAVDFSATGDATDVPCRFGSFANDGDWVRLELPSSLLPFIADDTLTQFMITASGATGVVSFSDAADSDFAPVLNLKYGPSTTTGIASVVSKDDVILYPNPTAGPVLISAPGTRIVDLSVFNAAGQLVVKPVPSANNFDLTDQPAGIYHVRVISESGVITKSVVKR